MMHNIFFGESWTLLKDIGVDNLKTEGSIIFISRKVHYYKDINSL